MKRSRGPTQPRHAVSGQDAGLFLAEMAAALAPGAGLLDAGGQYYSPTQGGQVPGLLENAGEGNYGTSALQGLGLLGDAVQFGGPLGLAAGTVMKLPGAAAKGARAVKGAREHRVLPFEQADAAQPNDWVRDPWRINDRQPVTQMRELSLDDLYLPELNAGQIAPEKRRFMPEYIERARSGEQPPPITVIEMENGRLRVIDGHRRVLAAREAGVPTIRARISPLLDGSEVYEDMIEAYLARTLAP